MVQSGSLRTDQDLHTMSGEVEVGRPREHVIETLDGIRDQENHGACQEVFGKR